MAKVGEDGSKWQMERKCQPSNKRHGKDNGSLTALSPLAVGQNAFGQGNPLLIAAALWQSHSLLALSE